jgi:hypothetical protein
MNSSTPSFFNLAQTMSTDGFTIFNSYVPSLQLLGLALTIFFVASSIYFIVITGWLQFRVDTARTVLFKHNVGKKRTIKAWKQVKRHVHDGDDNSLRLAVIEADKILDQVLKLAGYPGEQLGERLKLMNEEQLPNLNQIWEAHKLRNRIVHETNFSLNRATAERALTIYEQAFKDLELLS